MALKYPQVLYAGIVIAVLAVILAIVHIVTNRDHYFGGKKVTGILYSRDTKLYKRYTALYRVFMAGFFVTSMGAVITAFYLLAGPCEIKKIYEEKYARDIILCLDISTSVDDLNRHMLKELKNLVRSLSKERFGITIFNTTPVVILPLTDDYEAVIEQLDYLEECLAARKTMDITPFYSDKMFEMDDYISEGTLIGNQERGSSLIGDGLASTVYQFSDIEEDRTRTVIFTTDNDLQGSPYVTLEEAGMICKRRNITVYGIGTKIMNSFDRAVMKTTVEKTGGCFFQEKKSGTFAEIVDLIQKKSQNKVLGEPITIEQEKYERPFLILLFFIVGMGVFSKLLRR